MTDSGAPSASGRWLVDRIVGTAGEAHARPLPVEMTPRVWVMHSTAPAIVLGSTQSSGVVDHEQASSLGFEVAKRRSGGGAVLVAPGDLLWIDVLVPRADVLWDDDVGRSSHWLGRVWLDVVEHFGLAATVHTGPMRTDELARAVCFAGVGPGEVVAGSSDSPAKVVGISQRRTRSGARFQCACLLRWDPDPLLRLLPSLVTRSDLERLHRAGRALPDAVDGADVLAVFLERLSAC